MAGLSLASPEAEEALLACMLASQSTVISVMQQGLKAEDFGYDIHRLIFESILTVANQGGQVDAITVAAALDATGSLSHVGGAQTIERIRNISGDINLAMQYITIIRDRSVRRSLREQCESIISDLHVTEDVSDVVQSAVQGIYRVGEKMAGAPLMGLSGNELVRMWRNRSHDHGVLPYFYGGLNKVNRGRRPGSLSIWAGYTSDGKSIAGIQEAITGSRFARRVAIYSLEMTNEEIMMRMISHLTGIETQRVEMNDTTLEEGLEIDKAMEVIAGFDIKVYADSAYTPEDIRARQMRDNSDLIIVDYLQRFDYREYADIPRIAKRFKNLALDTKCCVDLLSQLTPAQTGPGANPFPRPSSNNLFGGKATGHEANNIFFIWAHRAKDDNGGWNRSGTGELIIEKARGGQSNWSLPIWFDTHHLSWKEGIRVIERPPQEPQTSIPLEVIERYGDDV